MQKKLMARKANHLRMTVAAGVLWGLGTLTAHAATLGYQQIHSKAGEPLQIDIPVTQVSAAEADGLKAVLAPREAFNQAGVTYSPALADVKLSLEKVLGDRYVIHVTSTRPIDETFLDTIIVLEWRSGRQSFIYTLFAQPENGQPRPALVIPPSVEPAGATAAPPAPGQALPAPSQKAQAPARPMPPPVTPGSSTAARTTAPGGTYTVQKGDTLSAVASQYATGVAEVTPEQMMLALYQANRNAFIDNDPNRIKAGAVLKLPDDAQAQSVTPPAARRFAQQTREQFQAYRERVAESVAQQRVNDSAGRSAGGAIEQGAGQQTVPAAPRDELKLSRADAAGKRGQAGQGGNREEDQIAHDKALAESQQRVTELEKNVADLQKLLALKNQALAGLQQKPAADNAVPGEAAGAGAMVFANGKSAEAGRVSSEETPAGASGAGAASAVAAAPAQASAPAAAANLSTWKVALQNRYAWAGAGLLAVLLGVGWLTRRRPPKAAASVGQEGPYDTGDDADDAHADAPTRYDAMEDRKAARLAQATGETSGSVPAGTAALAGTAAYAAQQSHASPETLAEDTLGIAQAAMPETSVTPAAPGSVAQMAGGVDLSLPGVPDNVGALPSEPLVDQTEDRPWASVKFTMAPEGTFAHHEDGMDGAAHPESPGAEAPGFTAEPAVTPPLKPLSFDLSGFDLDLKGEGGHHGEAAVPGQPAAPTENAPVPHDGAGGYSAHGTAGDTLSDIDTKLELASAYVAIGDDNGARELLEEVLREGDEPTRAEARKRLASLG